jgi:hypothetical protein
MHEQVVKSGVLFCVFYQIRFAVPEYLFTNYEYSYRPLQHIAALNECDCKNK